MALFNTSIDYQGQDLHMVRNGIAFPLFKFFSSSNNLNYRFRLLGNETAMKYENIEIKENVVNGVNHVTITASPYTTTTQKRVDNFYVTVDNGSDICVILIHLHDEINNFWTSPSTITFRKGMSVKFGLLASFTDGNYADLSYYPDIKVELLNNTTAIKLTEGRLEYNPNGEYPSIFPKQVDDVVEISLPNYLKKNTNTILLTKGNLNIKDNMGVVRLHKGDEEKINERINILCLSDGFNGNRGANKEDFHNIVNEFSKQLLERNTYSPWNLLGAKINLWSYYTEDIDDIASMEGECIVLNNRSNRASVLDIYTFIDRFDGVVNYLTESKAHTLDDYLRKVGEAYGQDFLNFIEIRNQNFSQNFPVLKATNGNDSIVVNFVNIETLLSKVGFPSNDDLNKDIQTLRNKWGNNSLDWFTGFKIQGDSLNVNATFLHDYVLKIWKKLVKRIYLEKSDTTYGVSNTYFSRTRRERMKPQFILSPGTTKFPSALNVEDGALKKFGEFINKIVVGTTQQKNIGEIFFSNEGVPKLNNTGNSEFNKIVKPCDNIIIMSKVHKMQVSGTNTGYAYPNYIVRRSIVSLDKADLKNMACIIDNINGIKYKLETINISSGNNEVHNTAAHEFSHNYLRDEYTIADNTLDINDVNNSNFYKYSNLQGAFNLKGDNANQVVDGSKIAWNFPRINKVGLGKVDMVVKENNIYKCVLEINTTINKSFIKGEKVLLRKRFLFEPEYIECTIESIVDSNTPSLQEVTIKTSSALALSEYKGNDYLIILPFWRDNNQTVYQTLTHHEIQDSISNTERDKSNTIIKGRALVEYDTPEFYTKKQEIDSDFYKNNRTVLNKFGSDKSRIVGLYAGGAMYYSKGLYHGTGFCLMRGNEKNRSNSFCPVCSYILIDYLDPIQHPNMDSNYGKYPN